MEMKRWMMVAAVLAVGSPAFSEDLVEGTGGAAVFVNASYSVNVQVTATGAAAAAQEMDYQRQMYVRSAGECEALLETIAATCKVTNISVSVQESTYPGSPTTLSVSANTTLEVTLKP
jgi:hypothetical protein